MEKQRKEFTNINNKYLADSLAFIGFTYYKFIDDTGKLVYTFKNTEDFNLALHKLLMLKEEFKTN